MARNQAADAQAIYDRRGSTYENSWHPRFARHMVELAHLQQGEHVLDLACGTGLVSYHASSAVGPTGSVVAIDISSGMLTQALSKLPTHQPRNVSFYRYSITELHSLDALKSKKSSFDVIICASALVLLPQPQEALNQWVQYLRPGGRLIIDVPHVHNIVQGIALERTGKILNRPIPSYRLNFLTPTDLRIALEGAGLESIEITPVSQLQVEGSEMLHNYILQDGQEGMRVVKETDKENGGRVFDEFLRRDVIEPVVRGLREDNIRERAKEVFCEEWRKLANDDGKVREIDCVYVGLGRKR